MGSLDGKVAFVTGAARGMGRAHAIRMAQAGADLIICDIGRGVPAIPYSLGTEEDLNETARLVKEQGRRVVSMLADVCSQDDLDAVVSAGIAELGRVDVLIANAGVFQLKPFWEIDEREWAAVTDTNLGGVWRSAKAVMPHMIRQGSGAMVLISSVNGLEPADGYAHYGASKHGVIGLGGSIALEGAPHGIRCNVICPGFVKTGMNSTQEHLDRMAGHPGATMDIIEQAGLAFHPLKGLSYLDPQMVADAALFLVSPAAEAITGVTLPVDAGHLMLAGRAVR
jgi:SDR family mycofactocin-dependent oxidoreductase